MRDKNRKKMGFFKSLKRGEQIRNNMFQKLFSRKNTSDSGCNGAGEISRVLQTSAG